MAYDLVIRNGLVVDGTGGPAREADIAINGDTIGRISDSGREEIDAKGCIVTPGFVDLHTHLDAQIGWDPLLKPISRQGVTTALMGNCGVTFAPCKPEDQEIIAAMMETVEDIPREAIMTGLPWTWENYGEYLDAIEQMNPAVNIGGLVGHCAIRYYVMGDRGAAMVMADVGDNGGLTLNKDFWVEFPKGYRSHQIRLEGGDCSTDSFCYPNV